MASTKKKTPEEFIQLATELAKARGFKWIGPVPRNISAKTTWECPNGHRWQTIIRVIEIGCGCPYCSKKAKRTVNDYHTLAQKRGFKWLGDSWVPVKTNTQWQCPEGHIWAACFDHIRQGTGCPYCAKNKPKTPEDYHNLAQELGVKWLGKTVKSTGTHTPWQCSKGHIWMATYDNLYHHQSGCPYCYRSTGEEKVMSFLDKFNFRYEKNKRFRECKYKKMLPFDFYFRIGKLNFLIEYDGKQHFEEVDIWGGKTELEEIQIRDRIKDEFAQKYDFILIRVKFTVDNPEGYLWEQIQSYLPHSLGKHLKDSNYQSIKVGNLSVPTTTQQLPLPL